MIGEDREFPHFYIADGDGDNFALIQWCDMTRRWEVERYDDEDGQGCRTIAYVLTLEAAFALVATNIVTECFHNRIPDSLVGFERKIPRRHRQLDQLDD